MDMQVAADASGSEDEPWTLPEGWCWTEIENIARLRGEKVNPSDAPHLPFVGMDDIPNDGLRVLNTKPFAQMKSAGNKFKPGDVLYGRLRPYLNKTAIASMEGVASGELLAIITAINAKYFQLFLHSRGFINRAMATVSGDRPRIDFSTISEFKIPLAPLPEQRRIVERIDALFAEIAEGEAALEAARKGLETFRRALLKAAVTGELTRDWRETHQPAETGHDLLARIKAERAATPAKGRGKSAAANPPLDTSDLPDLPEGWAWAMLGELGEIVGGATVDAKRKPVDPVVVPYLRVANVQRGHLDLTQVKDITVERPVARKLRLEPGDILLNEGGDRDKIGRGWIWDGSIPNMIHQNHVFRVRLVDGGLDPFFVSHHANEMGRAFFVEQGKQTTNLASISLSKISRLPVPVPPPQEVRAIMRLVSERLGEATEALDLLKMEAADAARLRQAILKSAFEGTLVPQDPADEPAAAMLKNLRQALPKVNPRRRGRGKAGHGG
ncbi:hypothetical protein ACO34A_21775 [Rhizobium sp. ACO-34A]|nr:restriction endonuclease subunit S [Rhizobium sp. ACO-34A]ATN36421.1 hypothetical protein ACO34A_21775 [Rhizobium sp. ACO-34A]